MKHLSIIVSLTTLLALGSASAQKWINPPYDAHRLDYRDLGYPDVNALDADNCPITALVTAANGHVYGATSGKASCLFLYDRSINKVRPLGRLGDAQGVYHAMLQESNGTFLIGGGLNMLAPVQLTQQFPGGFRSIEEQLWKDIAAPYANYLGGHLYRYDANKNDADTRGPNEPCPLEDLGIPVRNNGIYALAFNPTRHEVYGITYPDARFFAFDLTHKKYHYPGTVVERKAYSGPERAWRSVPRALLVSDNANGRVYTSGEDGRIIFYDPATQKIVRTRMQIPGEYYEQYNYYGYPVVEQWVTDAKGRIYGSTSDGYLFQMLPTDEQIINLGKARLSRRVRGMTAGHDGKLYLLCGEFQEPCKLYSYDPSGRGFCELGNLTVDRSPYYAKRAYQFDAMATGIDGTIFMGESDRRASLFLYIPGSVGFEGGFNPSNPR